MDTFASKDAKQRLAAIEEAASRLDLPVTIIEKDFWVCWTLRRLAEQPDLGANLTFKGGTSLSKAYGVIERFSEDIDLTIGADAPFIRETLPPMEAEITGNEARRRIDARIAAAEKYIAEIVLPQLEAGIEAALGTHDGWHIALDKNDAQTILFTYPRLVTYDTFLGGSDSFGPLSSAPLSGGEWLEPGYIRPQIKLEFGARGESDPHAERTVTPYLATTFPDLLPDAVVSFSTLAAERTFWEKATFLHALHHTGKIRDRLSRHYYDIHMLIKAGVAAEAIRQPDLLAQVVRNKMLMFREPKASYDTAVYGTLKLLPKEDGLKDLKRDYDAMTEMFMGDIPAFDDVVASIAQLEADINKAPDNM